jgi:AraC-like DNA-binding protein
VVAPTAPQAADVSLCDFIQICQTLVGILTFHPPAEWDERTRDVLTRADGAGTPSHLKRVLLSLVCLDACHRAGVDEDRRREMADLWQRDVDRCRTPECLFHESMRLLAPRAPGTDGVTRLRGVIEDRFSERLTLRTAAAMVQERDARSLDRAFRKRFGHSFHRYLTLVRLDHAVRLLETTELKVEGVAHEVGYRTKKELFLHIRREHGLTPGQLRTMAQTSAQRWHRDHGIRRVPRAEHRLPR